MSKQDRLDWIARGSPFRLMQPAADLRDVLRRHGYTVYDQGNRQHLEAEPPEDHTAYSETGYPSKAKYGVGYADDIMPPKPGQRSKVDGLPLPSLQQLGAQLLADRKANVAGIRWLKYMNWEPEGDNRGPCYQESWKPNHAQRTSTDRGHIHLSGLTGYETSTIGAGYDPVARIRAKEDDMFEPDDRRTLLATDARLREFLAGAESVPGDLSGKPFVIEVNKQLKALSKAVAALAARPAPGTVVISKEDLVEAVREVVREGVGQPGEPS